MKRKTISMLMCAALAGIMLAGCGAKESEGTTANVETVAENENSETGAETKSSESAKTTDEVANSGWEYKEADLTLLWIGDNSTDGIEAVCKAAEESLGIKVDIENMGGGEDADNIVKTRLASGDMSDMLCYNSGSLLAALNPSEYFYDLSGESFAETIDDNFRTAASVDSILYGIPSASTQVGAVLYNKDIYEKYGLSVPKTWEEFLANCEVLKAAGEDAVIGSFADSWTAQVPYLGDHYNVNAASPDFAQEFEAGTAKYAVNKAGLTSFQKMEDLIPYYNSDYLATSYDDACEMLVEGKGAQWFMLSSALGNMYSLYGDDINKIGCFAIPGDDAANTGITVWEPNALYVNKNSEKIDDIIRFFEFYISADGLDVYTSAILPDGPYCIKGYQLPENCYDAVKQMQTEYFEIDKACVALEFQTAVKGSNCASICQELGSGQTTAAEAAAKYDQDCEKQAKQLGLEW